MVQDNGFLGLMIRPDPRRTPPTIPCLLDSLCRVHDTILWARCMTESKQEMRYAVYHANDFHSRRRFAGFSAITAAVTVYRARCQGDQNKPPVRAIVTNCVSYNVISSIK